MAVNILALVQARMGSTRLPGKVMKRVNGTPLIGILLDRLSRSKKIEKIIVVTTKEPQDNTLVNYINELGYETYRGGNKNLLKSYYLSAKGLLPRTVVRITGDCPLIDPKLVDDVIDLYLANNIDYASNLEPPTFPDGLDTEVFSFESLETAFLEVTKPYDKEHVTPFIRTNPKFNRVNLSNDLNFSEERWTVDEPEDFEVIKRIINHFGPKSNFSWRDVLELKKSHPEYFVGNQHIKRNDGAQLGTGQKLWKRAKKIIPGGNMLLSKRAEMFLPEQWPAYFSKAKGCKVWDLDGNEYIDMSIMGIGTNILGYGHTEVDEAVRKVVEQGNMSTLNCPEEVYLAERLTELHPWADMVRFARSGGEATAIAIRIARAATGKDKIAFCGYHGWHDWYLSANLGHRKNLDGHLLPGLEPKGVPRQLQGTIIPFKYNDINEFNNVISDNEIGTVIMEVHRSMAPSEGFLEDIRSITKKKNITLIFDECTSGFRECFGGLHKKYGIEPDIAVFGKALGNGYPITAVIGKREIMEFSQSSFISSTFWTDRIGPVAGLKTLEVMEREKSWKRITKIGKTIAFRWKRLGKRYNLPIEVFGLPSMSTFTIKSNDWLKYKTLITQEMLKKGFLATNTVYASTAHQSNFLEAYFDKIEPIFSLIAECETGQDIDLLLEGPVCHSGFRRLN